jgi:predicted dehydrogenase
MRDVFASKDVDAVTLPLPNHWHALAAIWAMTAGKDVYDEKPAAYNIYEGQRMIDTARATDRIVQVGLQSRSCAHRIRAMQLLRDGEIGKVYMARGLCFKRRPSIGKTPVEPVPAGVDWDKFLGPAPMRPFTRNRFVYNWHWFWNTGAGDITNQGAHEMDMCRWGLGDPGMPKAAVSVGGKYTYDDDQEVPNTQLSTFDYGSAEIVFDVRGMVTGPEAGLPVRSGTAPLFGVQLGRGTVGNLFLGSDGWMWMDGGGFQVYKGEGSEKVRDEKRARENEHILHVRNFLEVCRSRKKSDLHAPLETGVMSASVSHLAGVSYRLDRKVFWDDPNRKFRNDPAADKLITRNYRKPYVV